MDSRFQVSREYLIQRWLLLWMLMFLSMLSLSLSLSPTLSSLFHSPNLFLFLKLSHSFPHGGKNKRWCSDSESMETKGSGKSEKDLGNRFQPGCLQWGPFWQTADCSVSANSLVTEIAQNRKLRTIALGCF